MTIPHQGELAALATAGCWTLTALSFESAGKRVGSLAVNLIRLAMGFFFLGAFTWIARGRPLPTDASPHAWLWLALSGLIGFALGDLCLFRACVLVGARISMLIMSLVPPMTALIGWGFLGERLGSRDWIGMALTVSGVVWVALERRGSAGGTAAAPARERHTAQGLLLAFGAAVGQAVGLILSKFGMGAYDPFASSQIRVLTGAAAFVVLFFALRRWSWVGAALRDRAAMARISVGAVFGPFLGVSFSLMAVQHAPAGVAATIISIVPVLIIAPAVLFLHEKVSARAVGGAVLAVAGVALLFL
jgi:drug/metabolite transporter (DMT)-like permease